MEKIKIIGGGLAGPEAAWQLARRGLEVELYEMRPSRRTPAHQTDEFAELVCSNSLKSDSENTAPWLLKEEMRRAGSLLMDIARETSVPAGHALAVDRELFARKVTEVIARDPRIKVVRQEVTRIDEANELTIIATGPLTSDALAAEIERLSASTDSPASRLYFYDSISPIVEADSIDSSKVYRAARYDKGDADYINCPMNEAEYNAFIEALLAAQAVDGHEWEKLNYFEGCLPIEEIARRGRDTLRFGPMKPVGLADPRTGRWPYAVVQLRQENLRADSYNIVGFQNHLKFGEQGGRVDVSVAVDLAEAQELGVLQPGNQPQHARLIAPLHVVLEPDQVVGIVAQVLLPQLDHRVGLFAGARIAQPDRLHGAEAQSIAAAVRDLLDRQASLEIVQLLPVLGFHRLGRHQRVIEAVVLFLGEGAVDVIGRAFVVARRHIDPGAVDRVSFDDGRDGVVEVEARVGVGGAGGIGAVAFGETLDLGGQRV